MKSSWLMLLKNQCLFHFLQNEFICRLSTGGLLFPPKLFANQIAFKKESNSMVQGIAENVMNANYVAQIHLEMGPCSY